jgi:hypothetical protein
MSSVKMTPEVKYKIAPDRSQHYHKHMLRASLGEQQWRTIDITQNR